MQRCHFVRLSSLNILVPVSTPMKVIEDKAWLKKHHRAVQILAVRTDAIFLANSPLVTKFQNYDI